MAGPGMRGTVSQAWADAPWTIKAFGVTTLIGVLVGLFTSDFDPFMTIGGVLLGGLFVYWLLIGSRVAWVVLLVFEAIGVAFLVWLATSATSVDDRTLKLAIDGPLRAIEIFVLVHPLTRAWVDPNLQAAEPQLP